MAKAPPNTAPRTAYHPNPNDGSGGKKPGKNQGPEDAGQSTKESGSLPFTVDVALQHGQRWVFPYMKRCFPGWVEPTEGLEPPTV